MSPREGPWAKFPHGLASDGRLSANDIRIALGLLYFAWPSGSRDRCDMADSRLAEYAGVSEPTVRRSLARMEGLGLIRREDAPYRAGNMTGRAIVLLWVADPSSVPEPPARRRGGRDEDEARSPVIDAEHVQHRSPAIAPPPGGAIAGDREARSPVIDNREGLGELEKTTTDSESSSSSFRDPGGEPDPRADPPRIDLGSSEALEGPGLPGRADRTRGRAVILPFPRREPLGPVPARSAVESAAPAPSSAPGGPTPPGEARPVPGATGLDALIEGLDLPAVERGAIRAVVPRMRGIVEGKERADQLVWDATRMALASPGRRGSVQAVAIGILRNWAGGELHEPGVIARPGRAGTTPGVNQPDPAARAAEKEAESRASARGEAEDGARRSRWGRLTEGERGEIESHVVSARPEVRKWRSVFHAECLAEMDRRLGAGTS